MLPISRILVSSSDFVLDKPLDSKGLTGLKENQIVEAKVLKILANEQAELMISGKKVIARTHVPLKENETIQLKVTKAGDTQVLKLVHPETADIKLPPGLGEMRASGRAGPYAKLLELIAGKMTGNDSVLSTQTGSLVTDGATPEPVPPALNANTLKSAIRSFLAGTPKIDTPLIPETIPQAELNTLKSFVETRGIPWEAKAVTLLAAKPEGLPAPVLKALNSLAGALIPQVQEGVVPKAEQNASIPIKDETLPVTLKQLAATVLSSAKTSDMNVLNDVAKAGPLPWNVKMLSLIMSAGKQSVPQELMKNAEEILIKTMLSMTSASENLASGATGITESVSGRAAIARASAGLKQLENLLGSIALQDGAQPNTAALKDLIKGSGLMWEAKLKTLFSGARFQTGNPLYDQSPEQLISKDMKALAMKLAEMVSRDDTDISRAVRSFADGLEKMQLLNTHSADESGRYLLPLPFFSDEELRLGQLLIELDRDSDNASGDRKKMVRVAVILEMSELGHLRADVTVYKKSINAWFGLETPGVKTVIDEALPDLKAKFEEIGYQVKSLGTKVMGQEALAGMTLTERLHDRDDSVLNIVI